MDAIDRGFESIFQRIPDVVAKFLYGNYDKLGHEVMTVAVPAATIWLGIKVLKVYTGQERADPWSATRALLSVMFVFWGLSWGGLAGDAFKVFAEYRDDTLRTLFGNQTLWQYVTQQNVLFDRLASDLTNNDFWSGAVMVVIGTILELLTSVLGMVVLLLRTTSDLGSAIVMLLFPLFAPMFFWENTRGYAMNWVGAMLKFMLVGILLGASLKLNFELVNELARQVGTGERSIENGLAAIIVEAFSILFVGFGVRPLASALSSSGAAGGGAAAAMAGYAMSKLGSALKGNQAGTSAASDAAKAMTTMSNTMSQMNKTLESIKNGGGSGSATGGAAGNSTASVASDAGKQLNAQPSGAGQPGGPGGVTNTPATTRGDW